MSGKNLSVLNLPPGVFRNASQYAVGSRWYDVNLVRWIEGILTPIGGWVKTNTLTDGDEPIRNMISWRDLLKDPWFALGSADKLWGNHVVATNNYEFNDITPTTLAWNPGGLVGYGRGAYGSAAYGIDSGGAITPDEHALWSMDNFGKLLVAVHSQDGRLFSWDPVTPTAEAAVVSGAPIDNQLVITTEEEFLMVMGGQNNPRRVKWASQRSLTDWTPTDDNTAGAFDLRTDGAIVAAVRTAGGILVVTDTDAHIVEYVGPPNYYGRRRISEEGGCIGQNCAIATPRGVVWIGGGNFWLYNGSVSKIDCSVSNLVFKSGDLSQPHLCHMGINEFGQEVWFQYPKSGSGIADRYAFLSYANDPYWSIGALERTAWLNPLWQTKPLAMDNLDLYAHETGALNDSASRNADVYAETGAIETEDGDRLTKVDRIYPDITEDTIFGETISALDAVTFSFKLKQAPEATERTYGPVSLNNAQGYSTVRFAARQIVLRVNQIRDVIWAIGKTRIRVKPGAGR